MYTNDRRDELIQSMKMLSENGFKCYIIPKNDNFMYGYIITPSDNVLNVFIDRYRFGWEFSLAYVPNRKTGSGCQCLENPVNEITVDIVLEAEKQGLRFARNLKAALYKSSEKWLKSYWNKDKLIPVDGDYHD